MRLFDVQRIEIAETREGVRACPPGSQPLVRLVIPAPLIVCATCSSPPPFDKSQLTFFVTSRAAGTGGGNICGLEGADAHCLVLAKAVGSHRRFAGTLAP